VDDASGGARLAEARVWAIFRTGETAIRTESRR
jgi:hypothetical protein